MQFESIDGLAPDRAVRGSPTRCGSCSRPLSRGPDNFFLQQLAQTQQCRATSDHADDWAVRDPATSAGMSS